MVARYLGMYEGEKVFHNIQGSMSAHTVIVGKSGSGKTVKAQQLMLETVERGCAVLTFDFHRVLADEEILPTLKHKFNQHLNDIDVYEDGITCNLLSPITNREGKTEQIVDTVASVTDIFAKYFRFGSNQRCALHNALKYVAEESMYDTDGIRALEYALLGIRSKVAAVVSERLEVLTHHNLFRPGEFFLKRSKINVLRLNRFDGEMQKFVTEMVLRYIWRLAIAGHFKEKQICIFVDEVSNFSKGDSILTRLLTEGRKLGVNLILATQHLNGLGQLGRELLQADMVLYFRPDDAQIRMTAGLINSQSIDKCAMVLSNLNRGEFVAVGKKLINSKEVNIPLKISCYEKEVERVVTVRGQVRQA